MIAFIDAHRGRYGVEPICRMLPIAPSTYQEAKRREMEPQRLPARARRDEALFVEVQRVHEENFSVYGRGRSGSSCDAKASRRPGARSNV